MSNTDAICELDHGRTSAIFVVSDLLIILKLRTEPTLSALGALNASY